MKIGILSDTHNHLPETKRALEILLRHGAEHLVHCGDAGEDVVDLISATCQEHGIRAHIALGNCDHFAEADHRFAPRPAGVERGVFLEFEQSGRRCAVIHGHDARRLDHLLHSGSYDYVFTGHTHRQRDEQVGRTRLLNPGSCARPRGSPPSVLLLDLATDSPLWIPIAACPAD